MGVLLQKEEISDKILSTDTEAVKKKDKKNIKKKIKKILSIKKKVVILHFQT